MVCIIEVAVSVRAGNEVVSVPGGKKVVSVRAGNDVVSVSLNVLTIVDL